MQKNYNFTRLACYIGYITQAISINLAPLFFIIFQDRYSISFAQIGQIVLITFVVQLAVDLVSISLVDRIGYRTAAIFAHVSAAAGLILFGILPVAMNNTYIGILLSVFVYSVGGGMTEVVISPLIDSLPGDEKAASMSILHSFYCWGQCLVVLITTLILAAAGQEFWRFIPFLWAVIPAVNIVLFCIVPIPEKQQEEKSGSGLKPLFKQKAFWLFVLIMLCGGASEQTMSQWASLFAEKALGVTKVVGDLLGPCLFAVLMGSGRILYGFFGKRLNMVRALLFCAVMSVGCYTLTAFCASPVPALIGCALCGFGVSLMWPGVLSIASSRYPRAGSPLFAVLALSGDMGCSLGPWISGVVSDMTEKGVLPVAAGIAGAPDQLAMKNGMLISALFPLIMAAALMLYMFSKRKRG